MSAKKRACSPAFEYDPETKKYKASPCDFKKLFPELHQEAWLDTRKNILTRKSPQYELRKKTAKFSSESKGKAPKVKFSPNSREEDVKTPDSLKSYADFLRLEEPCQSPMVTNESPVSSVSNIFGKNMLINSEKTGANNKILSQKDIVSEIRRRVEIGQMLDKDILELHAKHRENYRIMISLVDKLNYDSTESGSLDLPKICVNEF